MSSIPFDIIISILCCLPLKALVRFKTVLKSWQSLIDSPYFRNLHLARSIEANNLTLYIKSTSVTDHSSHEMYCTDLASLQNDSQVEKPENHLFKDAEICDSCNVGLFALYKKDTKSLVFWNPSTRKLYDAPFSTIELDGNDLRGIQFDASDNDYKVVVVRKTKSAGCFDFVVYSLKDKFWRTIHKTIDGRIPFSEIWKHRYILFNGATYWLESLLLFSIFRSRNRMSYRSRFQHIDLKLIVNCRYWKVVYA